MAKTETPASPLAALAQGADTAMLAGRMAAMMRTQAKMMDTVLKQNIEALDFVRGRYERDRELFAALSEARTPTDALAVWNVFWSKAVKDYSNEAGKLGSLAAATAEQMLEGLRDEATLLAGSEKAGD